MQELQSKIGNNRTSDQVNSRLELNMKKNIKKKQEKLDPNGHI